FHTRAAESRVVLCALWSLGPMSPIDGTEYDLDLLATALFNETMATNAIKSFAPHAPERVRQWAANRAILLSEVDEIANNAAEVFVEYMTQLPARQRTMILKSHAMDKSMIDLLKKETIEDFLSARQTKLKEVVRNFLETMTEDQFEDTPPLDDFDMDDEGRDDDVNN
ncbi:MAG TPA: hypothetical protein PK156_13090, partial [Polyangium sp.]|nr:hypothetical protein [Polyangium sp.]